MAMKAVTVMAERGDRFEVRLGRIRSPSGARRVAGLFRQLGRQARRLPKARRSASAPRALRTQFHRRVMVKASIVKMKPIGAKRLAAHIRYLERDGTTREGGRGSLFDARDEHADGAAFTERTRGDRHHFRFILSPEDSAEMADLPGFTRDLERQMEADLGTKLDWVAVAHYDTAQPHVHLLVRGVREDGRGLVIPRDYISYRLRHRAQDLVSLELGPVSELDGRTRLARMVQAERLTELDRDLVRQAQDGEIDLGRPAQRRQLWRQRLLRQRLAKLERLGLAEPLGRGRWRIASSLTDTLRRMGERGDIIRTLHRAMTEGTEKGLATDAALFDPAADNARGVTGEIIRTGIADDVSGRAFLVIDTAERGPLYVNAGAADSIEDFAKGQIVTVHAGRREPRPADIIIADIAERSSGVYSPTRHMDNDPKARPEFVQAHVRRLEALRRAGHVSRRADGRWEIPDDYLARTADYERQRAATEPPRLTRHTHLTLKQMETALGATWLDVHLAAGELGGESGTFAKRLGETRSRRLAWLAKNGFIEEGCTRVTAQTLETLRQSDLEAAGASISKEIGKPFTEAPLSGRVSGIYRTRLDRPSGRFAVIERAKNFTLVPWRDVMDRNLGRTISGTMRGQQISWTLTKGRGVS